MIAHFVYSCANIRLSAYIANYLSKKRFVTVLLLCKKFNFP